MPNWTSNKVTITGPKEELDKIQAKLKGKDTVFDFNAIIPMPESLNVEAGSKTDEAILVYLTNKLSFKPNKRTKKSQKIYEILARFMPGDWPKELYRRAAESSPERIEELYELGKQYVYNYDNYGYTDWYGWRNANWGTKWNSAAPVVSRSEEVLEYEFDTAWDAPKPVIRAFRKQFPRVKISFRYRRG